MLALSTANPLALEPAAGCGLIQRSAFACWPSFERFLRSPNAALPTFPRPQLVTGEIPNRGTMRDPRVPEECPQVCKERGCVAHLVQAHPASSCSQCWS